MLVHSHTLAHASTYSPRDHHHHSSALLLLVCVSTLRQHNCPAFDSSLGTHKVRSSNHHHKTRRPDKMVCLTVVRRAARSLSLSRLPRFVFARPHARESTTLPPAVRAQLWAEFAPSTTGRGIPADGARHDAKSCCCCAPLPLQLLHLLNTMHTTPRARARHNTIAVRAELRACPSQIVLRTSWVPPADFKACTQKPTNQPVSRQTGDRLSLEAVYMCVCVMMEPRESQKLCWAQQHISEPSKLESAGTRQQLQLCVSRPSQIIVSKPLERERAQAKRVALQRDDDDNDTRKTCISHTTERSRK